MIYIHDGLLLARLAGEPSEHLVRAIGGAQIAAPPMDEMARS